MGSETQTQLAHPAALAELGALLVLHAQTSVHAGAGAAVGTVDLPVQRERHTRWPLLPASSIKGVLRDACRHERMRSGATDSLAEADEDDGVTAAFGPAVGQDARLNAGALSFTDGRLLAFPVRSLKSVFAWITCPAVLDRFARDLTLTGRSKSWPAEISSLPDHAALVPEGSPLLVEGKAIVLEEFELARAAGDAGPIADYLSELLPDLPAYEATRKRMQTHLVVLPDEWFTHFCEHATEVVARVGLDYEKKTVRKGALFYQEQLPPECVFYSAVLAHPSRRAAGGSAEAMLDVVRRGLPPVLQIGGDATIGRGLCGTRLIVAKGGAA